MDSHSCDAARTGPVGEGEGHEVAGEQFETDPKRLIARQKQIDYGKATIGYAAYLKAVPREHRKQRGKDAHPRTPDVTVKTSKRTWDGVVRAWRRQLHKYDPHGQQADDSDVQLAAMPFPTNPDPQKRSSTPDLDDCATMASNNGARVTSPLASIQALLSPTDAPPSARKASYIDQATSSIKQAKRTVLKDSTNSQINTIKQWKPKLKSKPDQLPKPAKGRPSLTAADIKEPSACHNSSPVCGLSASGLTKAGHVIPSLFCRPHNGSAASLPQGTGPEASVFKRTVTASTAHSFASATTADWGDACFKQPDLAGPYKPPHQRCTAAVAASLSEPRLAGRQWRTNTGIIGTDKLPAHIRELISRRRTAYAATAC